MTIQDMFIKYALILAAIGPVAGFIGKIIWYGMRYSSGGWIRYAFTGAFTWAILTYILSLGSVFLMGFIIDALAPSFGAEKNLTQSMKIAVYSATAAWVAGALQILPILGILAILGGFYSLYLLYVGIKEIKNPPADKTAPYLAVVIVIQLVLGLLVGMLAAAITLGGVIFY